MPHPHGGQGNAFRTKKDFSTAYIEVGVSGLGFHSSTKEKITATQSLAQDGVTQTDRIYR